MTIQFPKVGQLKDVASFRARLAELNLEISVDDEILTTEQGSPMAQSQSFGKYTLKNRWCIHPMEGWDAHADGSPSEHTLRRWKNFGKSGAALIWGGEAAAICKEGRANPNQVLALESNRDGLAALLAAVTEAHRQACGNTDGFVVGLQLTHSGRFCRPNSKKLEPRIAYHHPLLDEKFHIDPDDSSVVLTDDDVERLIDSFVAAAGLAKSVGYQFVDVKACHGYLLHEFLSARSRPGKYGGDYDGRARFLKTAIGRIQDEHPDLTIGVRLSCFDILPYRTSRETGQPMEASLPYEFGFGVNRDDPLQYDLAEPVRLIQELAQMGVASVNLSCGSPYYNPHVQRPASFPPSDGYQPPEDPLAGVVRQIQACRAIKQQVPDMPLVGTAYSYLQDYLPHVAQGVVRDGWIDIVGLGRMVLSYPELPLDTLCEGEMKRKLVCRTFSDCTTAPRSGIISGCFPLDGYYKSMPEATELKKIKRDLK